jgi:hypothetical protein
MAEQVVHGRSVRGLELQVRVFDIPYQQALALQISANPPGPAAGAKASAFAAECHQPLVVAILAPNPQETVLQDTALEKVVELALHVFRQRAVLAGQQIEDSGVVLGDELV